jgi:cyanophycinase
VGYASAAPQSYSILNMRLDIRPLDIGQSLTPK